MTLLCRIFGHSWIDRYQVALILDDWDNPQTSPRRETHYEWQECRRCLAHHPDGTRVEDRS